MQKVFNLLILLPYLQTEPQGLRRARFSIYSGNKQDINFKPQLPLILSIYKIFPLTANNKLILSKMKGLSCTKWDGGESQILYTLYRRIII